MSAESKNQLQHREPDGLSYNLNQAGSMMQLASVLTDFVKEKRLSQNIQGRPYVNVEGWQFCGGMLGILPIVRSTKDISTADEIKFEADVELINIHSGNVVGAGNAVCSNKEKGKKHFEAFAVNSMAQTRAIGKAYRNMIGWLMKAAGFEATPAEEMDHVAQQENEAKEAVFEYLSAESREEVDAVWKKYPHLRKHPVFVKAAKAMSALFPKQEEKPAAVEMASEKQMQLITNLYSSHHVHDAVWDGEALTKEEATALIDVMTDLIAKGTEYEKSTPATPEQIETIEFHWDKPYFTEAERQKGLASLKKGYSIAQARATIAKMEQQIEERSKAQAHA